MLLINYYFIRLIEKSKTGTKTRSKRKKKIIIITAPKYLENNLKPSSNKKTCDKGVNKRVGKIRTSLNKPNSVATIEQSILDIINEQPLAVPTVTNESTSVSNHTNCGDVIWIFTTATSISTDTTRFTSKNTTFDDIIIPSDNSIINTIKPKKRSVRQSKPKRMCIDLTIKKKSKPKKDGVSRNNPSIGSTAKMKERILTLPTFMSDPKKSLIIKGRTKEQLKSIFPLRDKNSHYVYIIYTRDSNSRIVFYTGYTIDLSNRIRQHNGNISGGARYTSKFKNWEFLCFISGFTDPLIGKTTALQCEWKLKKNAHVPETVIINGKKYKTPQCKLYRKVSKINNHMNGVRLTSKSVEISDLSLTINWCNNMCYEYASRMSWPPGISNILFNP